MPAPVPVPMNEEVHGETGMAIHRCPSCGGVFASHATMKAVDAKAYERRKEAGALEMLRRAAAPPTKKVRCPADGGEMVRKEWSFSTLVFVDVCIECRGVWLDPGELEALEGAR